MPNTNLIPATGVRDLTSHPLTGTTGVARREGAPVVGTFALPDPIDLGAARALGDELATMHAGCVDLAHVRRAGRLLGELVARVRQLELRERARRAEDAA